MVNASIDKEAVITLISEFYSESREIATVVYEILTDAYGLDFEEIASEAVTEALSDDPTASAVRSAIDLRLSDFSLSDGQGQASDLYELEGDGETYLFGTDSNMEDEARAYVDQLIDEGGISNETIKTSWENGQSRKEWVAEAVKMDGVGHTLGRHDGTSEEVSIKSENGTCTWYTYVRTN